ncbi:MAG: UbiA family prenyltransferase [Melioribacteraceae bacterium]|nr:UbiA family prenyltransferase [Melioribacteraceae bacterium]
MDFKAYVKIIRPSACSIIAVTTLIGQVLALGNFPEQITAITAFLSSFLLSASSFTINDYVDYEIDLINTPYRPIPSGKISRKEALRYGVALGLAGGLSTLFLNPVAIIIGFTLYALTVFYTVKLKVYGFIGNIIVALSIALYFVFGYSTITSNISPYIISISSICFFYALGGEVAQSIGDAEGDKMREVKSIANMRGPNTAAIVVSICYALMAIMGAYTAKLFGIGNKYSSAMIISTIVIVGLITVPLLRNPSKKSAIRARNVVNAFAILIISGIFILLLI